MTIAIAPGGPGSRPTWTSSAKDMVTTALGTSRVWVTLGYGILNEVYWPATGLPQIRDLGFIVAGPSEWFEVKRVNRYHVSMPDDWFASCFRTFRSVALSIFGRPSFTPWGRARLRPGFPRCRIMLRSNSAKAPVTWKTSLPI